MSTTTQGFSPQHATACSHAKSKPLPAARVVIALLWYTILSMLLTGCAGLAVPVPPPTPTPHTSSADPQQINSAVAGHELAALQARVDELESRIAQLEHALLDAHSPHSTALSTQPEPLAPTESSSELSAISAAATEAVEPVLLPTATPRPNAPNPVTETALADEPETDNTAPAPLATIAIPPTVEWNLARDYLDQEATVCGPVVAAQFAQQTNGQPTFLNLGLPFPAPERFQVVIWGNQRANFPTPPEQAYLNTRICVTGRIGEYRGTAEMTIAAPGQIAIRQD